MAETHKKGETPKKKNSEKAVGAKKNSNKSSATWSKSGGLSFFGESYAELKKVHTPSRQETIQASILVLTMVVLFAIFLGLADFLVGWLMQTLLT